MLDGLFLSKKIDMRNIIYLLLLLTFSFTNNSCDKEENNKPEIPEWAEWSKITALKNGEIWAAGAIARIDERHNKDSVTIQIYVHDQAGYLREGLTVGYVPIKVGLFTVYRMNHNYTDDTKITATYTTISDDGDVVEDRFVVLESQNNYIEIKQADLTNMEMSGNLQITFIRDSLDTIDNPSLGDTIFFTDGVFRLKIVE